MERKGARWKSDFQLLKMRKMNIRWNIKTKYVTGVFLGVRNSSMKDYTYHYGINNEIWHINLYMNIGIYNWHIWSIESTKKGFLTLFNFDKRLLRPKTQNYSLHHICLHWNMFMLSVIPVFPFVIFEIMIFLKWEYCFYFISLH